MNLLTEPIISVSHQKRLSLPELLAALAQGRVTQFPALRPHQRGTWHMFLVQLATLALWPAKQSEPPKDSTEWATLLRRLTPDHTDDAPWCMVVGDLAKPAFLQPPAPDNVKWSPVATPDALDLLITARNHDLKQSVAREVEAEDWLFALVSLQTSEGYGGAGNHGIARMNGGSSSRPMLGLGPAQGKDYTLNPSAWWRRDVRRLLAERQAGNSLKLGCEGGLALLWCLDWPEGEQLDLRELDPWFIEVCRRVRLVGAKNRLSALRAISKASRIDAKMYHGNVGDPWTPVHRQDGKSLTLGGGDFHYKRLAELMFGGDWQVPVLAKLGPEEETMTGDRLLVAEALSRGNSKTEGFKSRVVPVPDSVKRLFQSPTAATLSKLQMEEIKAFDEALRNAIALLAARGDWDSVGKPQYAVSKPTRDRFDRTADTLFFPNLWARLEAETSGDHDYVNKAGGDFRRKLLEAAKAELAAALPGVPCSTLQRPKAETRAWRAFHARIHKLDTQLYQNSEMQEDIDAEP